MSLVASRFPSLAIAAVFALPLLGCPPDTRNVCGTLQARSPSGTPDRQAECMKRLEAMRDRSSGEYGMCSQCVMNAVDDAQLAQCRPQCRGLDDLLPTLPPTPAP